MANIIKKIYKGATAQQCAVVLPEATDKRILSAAIKVKSAGLASPILLGSADEVQRYADQYELDIDGITIYDPKKLAHSSLLQRHLGSCKHFASSHRQALISALHDPLLLGCSLLATGEVDACVAGAISTSRDVIRQGLRIIGVDPQNPLLSSFFLMVFDQPPAKGLDYALFADCAININPDGRQLAQIAMTTAGNARHLFGLEPKLAFLSFSTDGSSSHADSDKVALAVQQVRQYQPEQKLIGEVQFDAALSHSVRESKMPYSDFSGPANVFIFPDLDAGNIGAKITERIGGAHCVGPILQGLKKPLNDLSRGTTVTSIVNTIAISCLQAAKVPAYQAVISSTST